MNGSKPSISSCQSAMVPKCNRSFELYGSLPEYDASTQIQDFEGEEYDHGSQGAYEPPTSPQTSVSSLDLSNLSPSEIEFAQEISGRVNKKGKVKRPRNAFIFFRSHFNASNKKSAVIVSKKGNNQTNVSCKAGEAWKNLSPSEKAPFESKANLESDLYKYYFPNYKYVPGNSKAKSPRQPNKNAKPGEKSVSAGSVSSEGSYGQSSPPVTSRRKPRRTSNAKAGVLGVQRDIARHSPVSPTQRFAHVVEDLGFGPPEIRKDAGQDMGTGQPTPSPYHCFPQQFGYRYMINEGDQVLPPAQPSPAIEVSSPPTFAPLPFPSFIDDLGTQLGFSLNETTARGNQDVFYTNDTSYTSVPYLYGNQWGTPSQAAGYVGAEIDFQLSDNAAYPPSSIFGVGLDNSESVVPLQLEDIIDMDKFYHEQSW